MLQAFGVNRGAETRLIPFPSSGQAHSKKGKLVMNIIHVSMYNTVFVGFELPTSAALLKIQFFWDVMLCHWTHPVTQHHVLEDMNLQYSFVCCWLTFRHHPSSI